MKFFVCLFCFVLFPTDVWAFCGLYVNTNHAKLTNKATEVVLMRDGIDTVMTMRNHYDGPLKDFAMIVPVPQVLQTKDVRVLTHEVLDYLNRLTSPRLVKYDGRCIRTNMMPLARSGRRIKARKLSLHPTTTPRNVVTIKSFFKKGEYDIVVLSATDSTRLFQWLKQHNYKIPKKAKPILRAYIQRGMYFMVAKVNIKRVMKRQLNGKKRHVLSPLRIYYQSKDFMLPVRLGMVNAKGPQSLLVHTIAFGTRYKVKNAKNMTMPTNIFVDKKQYRQFERYYNKRRARFLKKHNNPVITEYAWGASKCDPCPTNSGTLGSKELLAFGLKHLKRFAQHTKRSLRIYIPRGQSPFRLHAFDFRGVVRQHINPCLSLVPRDASTQHVRLGVRFNQRKHQTHTINVNKDTSTQFMQCIENKVPKALDVVVKKFSFKEPVKFSMSITSQNINTSMRSNLLHQWVLTRMYTSLTPTKQDDLRFVAASPIEGGRGFPFGSKPKLSTISQNGAYNRFQGRYIYLRYPNGQVGKKCNMRWFDPRLQSFDTLFGGGF